MKILRQHTLKTPFVSVFSLKFSMAKTKIGFQIIEMVMSSMSSLSRLSNKQSANNPLLQIYSAHKKHNRAEVVLFSFSFSADVLFYFPTTCISDFLDCILQLK